MRGHHNKFSLREKCPIRSFFWSVFSPNTEKYGPEKTPYLDNFHAVIYSVTRLQIRFRRRDTLEDKI